ncbi:Flp family type IVb pilin [Micromonospora sp. NPDC047740]|uniref:Flp family type IVb pilin n=1 Tax=Micromonospora sp. NPDC047740 TaxID=3364254 RepID=UPI00371C77C2
MVPERRLTPGNKFPFDVNGSGRDTLMVKLLSKLRRRDEGASAVEYGLLVALIAVAIVVAVGLLGDNLSTIFDNIANTIGEAAGGGGGGEG